MSEQQLPKLSLNTVLQGLLSSQKEQMRTFDAVDHKAGVLLLALLLMLVPVSLCLIVLAAAGSPAVLWAFRLEDVIAGWTFFSAMLALRTSTYHYAPAPNHLLDAYLTVEEEATKFNLCRAIRDDWNANKKVLRWKNRWNRLAWWGCVAQGVLLVNVLALAALS